MTPVCSPATETPPAFPGSRFSTRAQLALATCACAGASAFLFAVDPNRHAVYPQCLLYNTTGLYCAGCGATRALHALLHGRVLEALHDNVLFIAALPWLLYLAGSYVLTAWQANAWPAILVQPRKLARIGIWLIIVMLGFAILRNLPGPAFEWLKPLAN